jgi:hypothetical protein
MKRILRILLAGGAIAWLSGTVTGRVITGVCVFLIILLLFLAGMFIKHLFHRNKEMF